MKHKHTDWYDNRTESSYVKHIQTREVNRTESGYVKHKHRLVGQPDRIWLCETRTYRLVRQPDRIWLCETHREIHSVHLVEMWTNYTTAEVKFLPLDSFLVKTNETHRHAHTGEWVLIATCLGGVNWKNKFLLAREGEHSSTGGTPPPSSFIVPSCSRQSHIHGWEGRKSVFFSRLGLLRTRAAAKGVSLPVIKCLLSASLRILVKKK